MSEFNAQKIIDEHGGKCRDDNGRMNTLLRVVGVYVIGYYMDANGPHAMKWHALDGVGSNSILIMPRTVVTEWWDTTHKGRVWSSGLATLKSARRAVEFKGVIIHTTLYSDDTVESEVVK